MLSGRSCRDLIIGNRAGHNSPPPGPRPRRDAGLLYLSQPYILQGGCIFYPLWRPPLFTLFFFRHNFWSSSAEHAHGSFDIIYSLLLYFYGADFCVVNTLFHFTHQTNLKNPRLFAQYLQCKALVTLNRTANITILEKILHLLLSVNISEQFLPATHSFGQHVSVNPSRRSRASPNCCHWCQNVRQSLDFCMCAARGRAAGSRRVPLAMINAATDMSASDDDRSRISFPDAAGIFIWRPNLIKKLDSNIEIKFITLLNFWASETIRQLS